MALLFTSFVFNLVDFHPFEEVEERVPKNAKIIVACAPGGTLKPTQSLPGGKESR